MSIAGRREDGGWASLFTRLGLPTWRRRSGGLELIAPAGPAEAAVWLASPALMSAVEAFPRSAGGPERLADGVHLLAVPGVMSGGDAPGVCLLMSREACRSAWFADVARSANVDAGAAKSAFESLLPGERVDPERTAALLAELGKSAGREAQFCRSADDATEVLNEVARKLVHAYEELRLTYRLADVLSQRGSSAAALVKACEEIRSTRGFSWVAAKISDESVAPELAGTSLIAGPRPAVWEEVERQLDLVADRPLERIGLLGFSHDLGDGTVAQPIDANGKIIGVLAAGHPGGEDAALSSEHLLFLEATAKHLGMFHESVARVAEQRAMFMGTLRALTAAIDAKDPYTRGHSERVSLLSERLAAKLGLPEEELEVARIAGLIHDVGKIGVPEAVLCKQGRLTAEEFEHIKRHPVIGHEILRDIPMMAAMLPGVRSHHERWDGRGYPDGLSCENIPMLGRIIACADAFDAMSSTRSYRVAMPRDKVLAEFERCSGTQFDPVMAKAFLELDLGAYDAALDAHRAATARAA